ncbi:MAG: hypothetical protein PHS80_09200 [Methanothrix sp.]|nr:hypothetical protein [Methanothrix sp.]
MNLLVGVVTTHDKLFISSRTKGVYMYFSGERQKKGINSAIVSVLESRKEPVSISFIASEIGRSPPVVQSHLVGLSKDGIVQFANNKAILVSGT